MYYSWEQGISPSECEKIIKEYKDNEYVEATVYKEGQDVDLGVRQTKIQWVDPNSFLFRAVRSFMKEANEEFFKYNMGESENVQFAKYGVGEKYGWHKDTLNESQNVYRKLTTLVQLSSPDDYKGGVFEFFNGEHTPEEPNMKKQGAVIVFDSRDWHRLTPVAKGVRYSLAQWSQGVRFI